ncbi:hypothetical protein C0995_006357 [Termitomyces sp. Mi166|nr:hypothetical protein C0995_006357 [Termitomyces sp. Mi166\
MVIELKPTVPIVVPKTVMNLAPTPVSATLLIQHAPSVPYIANPSKPSQQLVPRNKGKGKAKAMEDDEDEEGEATQKSRKEPEDFMVPTKFDDKQLASLLLPLSEYYEGDIGLLQGAKILGGRKGDITLVSPAMRALVLEKNGAKKWPPLSALVVAKHVKLVQVAKAFLKRQSKSSQFSVLEDYKGKGKAKALLGDFEQAGTKRSFKSTELVDSDSHKEEEDRVHIIKKVKREHIEELTGTRKRKEIIELDEEVEIVVPKTPVAGPLCQTSKPVVLVPRVPKPIPRPIIVFAFPVAGPSTASIVPSSAPKPAATAALSKPAPVKSAGPAIKGGFIFKDPFMVRQFKLVGTEESGVLIINQATEVLATQGTLQGGESSDKDGNDDKDSQGDDDNSNDDDVTMDIDSVKCSEET